MINGRMIKVLDFLYSKKISSYKEIAKELEIKERLVRYDVDRINDMLLINNLPVIERKAKGQLVFPEQLSISDMKEDMGFIYTQQERMELLLLMLFFDAKTLKLNKIANQFQISRSTLKNDLSLLERKLKKYSLCIQYEQCFYLQGNLHDKINVIVTQFEQYITIIKNNTPVINTYEKTVLKIIKVAFDTIDIRSVIGWVDDLLDSMQCVLTDHSYRWYVSNVLILVWFILQDQTHPLELSEINHMELTIFDECLKELAVIIKKEVSLKKAKILIRLLNYTNKNGRYEQNVNLILVEEIVQELIVVMSKQMELSFKNDIILFEGLINHVTALVTRIGQGIRLEGEVTSILGTKDLMVFEMAETAIRKIEILSKIDSNEIAYLAIHFIASIKRIQDAKYTHVLLVCGYGYGTTLMLKETLKNEFQIKVVDTIPTYRIQNYEYWDKIEYVIATSKIDVPIDKPLAIVNPILTQQDYSQLSLLGIARKKVLANYYSINKHLDFLSDDQRLRVLEVIRNELGHQVKTTPSKINKLTDLLTYENLLITKEKMTWETSVYASANLLKEKDMITDAYIHNILDSLQTVGFYAVMDESFALLHGENSEGVQASGMSLLITQEPVFFGEKKIHLIFTLASKDSKEHIPAVITWVRMIKNTNIIEQLVDCQDKDTAYQIVLQCEGRVLQG